MSIHRHLAVRPFLITVGLVTALPVFAGDTLTSFKTSESIELDGIAEIAWTKVPPLLVVLDKTLYKPKKYEGILKTEVSIRSLYDNDYIYFFVQWDDPTKSLEYQPWVKGADNTWQRLMDIDQTGHENTYYEDKLGIYWNINAEGFETKGCGIACHMADSEGKVAHVIQASPGRKFTRLEGETIDLWHWKAVRTGLAGQLDDQFVDSNIDPVENKDWGKHGDHSTGGGYRDNITDDMTGPAMGTRLWNDVDGYAIGPNDQVLFYDTFKPGNRIASVLAEPFTGSRGDISAAAVWKDGRWSLEFKRKRVTSGENADIEDIQFSDLSKSYYFGIAVFDNSQINHLYSESVLRLNFEQ